MVAEHIAPSQVAPAQQSPSPQPHAAPLAAQGGPHVPSGRGTKGAQQVIAVPLQREPSGRQPRHWVPALPATSTQRCGEQHDESLTHDAPSEGHPRQNPLRHRSPAQHSAVVLQRSPSGLQQLTVKSARSSVIPLRNTRQRVASCLLGGWHTGCHENLLGMATGCGGWMVRQAVFRVSPRMGARRRQFTETHPVCQPCFW